MDNDLQKKIDILGLKVMDEKAYNKYLEPYKKENNKAGIDVDRFKYYKLYGEHHVLYSMEYLERTSMEELLEKDKNNYSFFVKE
ncbi:hydrolase [Bacillus mycoides]|uniref:Hydrolase n=1 Tax=Bacillus mycoides TaxID=1405 RepID=A0A1W6A2R7_BACMY|nr:hydrolase [Bacillus mycoides]ARJ20105.1 hydrolase [Bacillus mycoides]